MCKKKGDLVDGNSTPSRQRSFKGIISKWNLKPKWKSDSHLNKQRCEVEEKNVKNKQQTGNKENTGRPLSKSSDWTDVPLVAATDETNHYSDVVYVKNAQLSLIFNDNHTPTPPPRKHHKKPMGLREKIKAVAKQGLQAVQSSNSSNQQSYANKKPVEEPLCVKKIINYNCPHCDAVSGTCHRHRAHEAIQAASKVKQSFAANPSAQNSSKSMWDRKSSSASTNSLPNQYGEGKLSIAIDDLEDIDTRSSVHSLPGVDNNDGKQQSLPQNTSTPNDIMSRARSFGSLLPQILLHKLSTNPSGANHNNSAGNGKAPLAEIESDDSFGGLEEWDIGLIEHYNPKDASLPRGVKMGVSGGRRDVMVGGDGKWRDSMMSNEDEVLASLEGMIVNDVDELTPKKPEVPQRKAESLLKKITRENSNRTSTINDKLNDSCQRNQANLNRSVSVTPPPSPEKIINDPFNNLNNNNKQQSADHSTLMKIIEDYKQEEDKIADRTIDLYRHLSTEEALVKSISKTTSNVDTVTHCDITRKTYTIEDDVSKFDSPNTNEFKRMSVTDVNVNNVNLFGKVEKSVASMQNDFLNAERRFVTETDLYKHSNLLKI